MAQDEPNTDRDENAPSDSLGAGSEPAADAIFESGLGPPDTRPRELVRPTPQRPMVFAALALIAGIVLGDAVPVPTWSLLGGIVLILGFAVFGLIARRGSPPGRAPLHTGFLLIVVLLMFGWMRGADVARQDARSEEIAGELEQLDAVRVSGVVALPPQLKDYGWRVVLDDVRFGNGAGSIQFPLRIQAVILHGTVRASAEDRDPPCPQGARIALTGRVRPRGVATFPGDFDERLYLASHAIGAKFIVKSVRSLEILDDSRLPARIHSVFARARRFIVVSLTAGMGDASRASLAAALLIGERSGISPDLNEAFARTGLVHILSVSGYHTGIVLLFILGVLRCLGLGPRATAATAMIGLAVYAALTGFNPPVVRASFMGVFMLGGWMLGRHTTLLSGLAVSALLTLVFDPRNLFRPDWQLSYLCVLSITLFAPPIYESLPLFDPPERRDAPSRMRQFARTQILLPVIVVFAVQVGMLPLQLHYFGRLTIIGFVIQPVAVFMVMVGMAFSILTCVFAWLPAVSGWFGALGGFVLGLFESGVQLCGSPDWSAVSLPRMPVWMIVIYLVAIFQGPHLLKGRGPMNRLDTFQCRHLLKRLVVLVLLVIGLWLLPSSRPPTGILDLYVVDVGQGDALVLRFPNGKTALIDGGRGFGTGASTPDIVRFLQALGARRLDLVVATHADADHIGGLPAVLREFQIGMFVHGPDTSGSDLFDELRRGLESAPFPVRAISAGETLDGFAPVTITALNPLPGTDNNDASVTLLVDFQEIEMLLTGDIESRTERRILESGRARDIEVLKVPHHGSASSTTSDFLDAFQPEIALISVGRNNIYRHPSPFVLERLRERGILTARTDRMGTLLLRTDGRQIRLFHYGEKFR